ncbi:hypothetical protein F444_18753 [Phytophthora nicotianae P1976]|uniref:Kinesin motor domain-containing protein n=1 Tax=Phytophthora nicotianae P1976 TaxID=1317066 RepID=A0A080ZA95_PHYNI|nr:hypothetical protein F444_18753 [Phytophthora nicotianae P1976]
MARPSPANNEMGNVRVCCRVRPQNAKELTMTSAQRCVFTENQTIEVKVGASEEEDIAPKAHFSADFYAILQSNEGSPQKFTFDHVFGEEDNQKTVFENVALPVVQGTAQYSSSSHY